MTLFARPASIALGCFGLLVSAYPGTADERGSQYGIHAAHCSNYGSDYKAVEGSDVCARIGGRIRVQPATNAGLHPEIGWSAGRASSATLRSEGESRAEAPTHLRVQGGLEYPNPFR